jgi:hypothetical protein
MNAGAIFVTVDADYSKLRESIAAATKIVERGGRALGEAMSAALGGTFARDVQEELLETGRKIVRSQEVVGRAAGAAFSRSFLESTQRALAGGGGAGGGAGAIVRYVAPQPGAMVLVGRQAASDIADGLDAGEIPLRSSAASMGKKIGTETSKGLFSSLTKGINEQAKGAVMAVLGVTMADRLMRGMADAIRGDKSIGEALHEVITSVPIIGGAFELGEAIGAAAIRGMESLRDPGAADRRAADIAYEDAMNLENARNTARKNRQDAERAYETRRRYDETQHLDMLRRDLVERETDRAKMAAQARGDDLRFLEIEYGQALEALRAEERKALGPLTSKDAADAANAILAERRRLLDEEFADRRMKIEEEIAKETELNRKAAEELEILRIEATRAEFRYAMEQQEKLKRVEEESLATRIEAQRAGVGSVSTFAGEFRFDAYPETEKRRNDNRMVDELKKIRERIAVGGFA